MLVVCAAIVFTVVLLSTGAQIRDRIDRDVAAQAAALERALQPLSDQPRAVVIGAARRYIKAQPYGSTPTLLFVILRGAAVVSNHPEVFGSEPTEPGETRADQAQENRAGSALSVPRPGRFEATLLDIGRLRMIERSLPLRPAGAITVGAGQPLAEVEQAQHSLTRAFLLAGAVVLLLACLASYLAGARVSAPLRRLAGIAARVDAGDLAPRMAQPAGSGTEIAVLSHAFNGMLDRLEQAFASQRAFVADASHELRTPLTVIRGQLDLLAAQEAPAPDEIQRVERLVQGEVGRMGRLVDDLLLLAAAEQREFLLRRPIRLESFVPEVWEGLPALATRRFELGAVPRGTLHADPDRVAQALRNLAANAVGHTEAPDGLVRLDVRAVGHRVRFLISDDGPGIPPGDREQVFARFHRLDDARARNGGGAGAGLGLAIVRAIAEAHGGLARAVEPEPGSRGARMELELPGFRPDRDRPAPRRGHPGRR